MISEACGIPRGSILHQFPTRLDLMASVIEFITSEMTLNTQQLLAAEPDPKVRLLSFFSM
ncbi:TetR/AcrR family transcriptional regulator [Novosphingobium colocasiae]